MDYENKKPRVCLIRLSRTERRLLSEIRGYRVLTPQICLPGSFRNMNQAGEVNPLQGEITLQSMALK